MTGLFSTVQLPQSNLFRFIAPSLQPYTLVKEIISALDDQESRIIRLPLYTNFARVGSVAAGLVPGWLRDLIQWVSRTTPSQLHVADTKSPNEQVSNADYSMVAHDSTHSKQKNS
jgi:hypothetical protein